ncbi:MAG: 2-oxo acid dehydrogenase subunit E2, partial [Rhodospirillaceae bacterium]
MSQVSITVPEDQAEGTQFTLRAWLKSPGSSVELNEPIAEIETDKVTMEVPAPSAGILVEDLVDVGAEVQPGMVIGSIKSGDPAKPEKEITEAKKETKKKEELSLAGRTKHFDPALRLSPSVRRLLSEHDCDPSAIAGTGRDGRITRADVLAYIDGAEKKSMPSPARAEPQARQPASRSAGGNRKVPHDSMRRSIAEHMQRSVSTAPHVTAVFEAYFTAIMRDRKTRKEEFKRQGVNLTYTAYFIAASVRAIQEVPTVNSRWHDDSIE